MANRLNAVSPRQYVDRQTGETRTAYSIIGTAFETQNGWAIRLESLPLPQIKDGVVETTILLLPPKDNARSERREPARSGAPAPAGSDDDIPFAPEWR